MAKVVSWQVGSYWYLMVPLRLAVQNFPMSRPLAVLFNIPCRLMVRVGVAEYAGALLGGAPKDQIYEKNKPHYSMIKEEGAVVTEKIRMQKSFSKRHDMGQSDPG